MPSAFMALALAEIFRVGEAPMRWTFSEIMVHLPRRPAGRSLLRVFGLGGELGLEEIADVGPGQRFDHIGHLGQDLGHLARDLGRAEVLVPADDDDLVDLGQGLRHGPGQLGQDLDVGVEDGGLGVLLPGLGLLHHGLGLGAALGPDLVGLGQALELHGFGFALGLGGDPELFGLGLGLDLVFPGVGRLDDRRFELPLLAGDLELLGLDGLFLLDLLDLGLFLLQVLADPVALELVGEIGLGLLGVDEDLGLGLLGLVLPLGLGDQGLGLKAGHLGFLAGLGGLDDRFLLGLGLGDGRVALGGGDLGLAQGIDVALRVADVLEGEGEHDQAHPAKSAWTAATTRLRELLAAAVDLLDRHAADDLADFAFEDVDGHVADAVAADPQELLGGEVDGLVGRADLDLGRGLGHDRNAAAGQDLGRADGHGDDVHGEDIDLFHPGPDEDAAAEAVAVADLLRRPVGQGDGVLAAPGDDEGLVRPDLAVTQGQDQDDEGEEDDDGAGDDEPGCQWHDDLLGRTPRVPGEIRKKDLY